MEQCNRNGNKCIYTIFSQLHCTHWSKMSKKTLETGAHSKVQQRETESTSTTCTSTQHHCLEISSLSEVAPFQNPFAHMCMYTHLCLLKSMWPHLYWLSERSRLLERLMCSSVNRERIEMALRESLEGP